MRLCREHTFSGGASPSPTGFDVLSVEYYSMDISFFLFVPKFLEFLNSFFKKGLSPRSARIDVLSIECYSFGFSFPFPQKFF